MNALKDFKMIRFSSKFDPTSNKCPDYELTIKSENNKGQQISNETKYPITSFYDEFGYLHRYVVKENINEAIQ